MIKYMEMKKVLHFGAGNIGRGFFGQLYYESGYHTIFVDMLDWLIDELNKDKQYPVWIVGKETEKILVRNVSGIKITEVNRIIDEAKNINLMSFSVGVNNIKGIIPVLAKIIENKAEQNPVPLNIIIGENIKDGAKIIRDMLKEKLSRNANDYLNKNVGLVETVLSRMIPYVPDDLRKQYPLIVLVEPYKTMPVAKNMFKGSLPEIKGFLFVENIETYEAMKLYIHNLTHACFAYSGYLKKHHYIWQATEDKKIKNLVDKAYGEIRLAIHKKFSVSLQELDAYYYDLLERFSNRGLGDTVVRVAREPIRKLGCYDRFIGAANLCLSQHVNTEYIC